MTFSVAKRRLFTKKLVVSAMLLAMGVVLPFATGQIPEVGSMLLPMHIPVFLCGFVCGWQWGLGVGFVLPLLRSVTFGMPPPYPGAVAMAFELAAYGALCGLLYAIFMKKTPLGKKEGGRIAALYIALVCAMVGGRVVWGAVQALLLGLSGTEFPFSAFLAGALLNAFPGIALQLVLIPAVITVLRKTKVLPLEKSKQ